MNKFMFFLVFVLGMNVIHAQTTFGIRRVNTKAGAIVDVPRIDSKHYKMQLPKLKQDIDVKILFRECVDGKYIEDNLTSTTYFAIPKEHVFTLDFVPELQSNGTFKLYTFYPGVTKYYYMFPIESKCLKFIPCEPTEILFNKPLNMLLIYEDNENGEVERLVDEYIVDGVLKTDFNSEKILRSKLRRYSVFYYIIDDKKK